MRKLAQTNKGDVVLWLDNQCVEGGVKPNKKTPKIFVYYF